MARPILVASIVAVVTAGHAHENDLSRIKTDAVKVARRADATLTLNATEVTDGAYVRVHVVNDGYSATGDWLGIYTVDADPTATVPLKWSYCSPYIPGYNTSGTGDLTLQVYAVRAPLIVHLFQGGTSSPTLVASSSELSFADYAAPTHPRVLPGVLPGDYRVLWTTNATGGDANPRLMWGTVPGEYPHSVPATTEVVEKSSLCGAPATTTGFMDLGVTATAELTGLASAVPPGTRIYYVMTDDDGRMSAAQSFAVPPLPGASYPFHFVAFGDLGRGSWDGGITWREYGQDSRSTSDALAEVR